MEFTCSRKAFFEKLTNIQRTVSTKAVIPVLEGILIKAYDGKITLCSYDLEIGTTTDMDANIVQQGEVVLKAKLLVDVVSKLPSDNVHISTNDKLVTEIKCGSVKYQLAGISPVEFPDLPTFEEKTRLTIKATLLQDMIRKVRYAISDNNQKPVYTGALFDIKDKMLNLVAVDGFRMAIRRELVNMDNNLKFIVPGKTLSEVLRFNVNDDDNIEVIIGQRHITFKINEYHLVSRLLDGIFIDYNATVTDTAETSFVVSKSTFMGCIERMAIMNSDKLVSPVTCVISENEIKFSSVTSAGSADETLEIMVHGDPLTIGFNNRYLLDALRNCDTDKIKMDFNGARKPLKIMPLDGDSFLFIVLPMRLS